MAQDDSALNDPNTLRREAAATRARISANVNACEERLRTYVRGASGNEEIRAVRREARLEKTASRWVDAFELLCAGAATGYKVARWWRSGSARRR
jgi:hypothetical protein